MHKSCQKVFRFATDALIFCALLVIFAAHACAEAPEAVYIENWDQLYAQIRLHGEARDEVFSFSFAPEMKLNGYSEELDNLLRSCGCFDFRYEMNGNRLDISYARYYKDFAICDSSSDVFDYVQYCAEQDLHSFFIYFPPGVAEDMFANECYNLDHQLIRTRLRNVSGCYAVVEKWNRAGFSNAFYLEKGKNTVLGPGEIRDVYQFAAELKKHTNNLELSFEFLMAFDVTEEVKGPSTIDGERPLYREFLDNAGIVRAGAEVKRHFFVVSGAEYYPGKEIAWFYQNGRSGSLNEKQRETLDAALEIARSASGSETQRARQIHDALCKKITYDSSRGKYDWFGKEITKFEDMDTAIGALLEGRADCDGYSDAFYLCASLAGIDVCYLHGKVQDKEDSSHLRNIARLDGNIWRMIDVTWDDVENGDPSYECFDIGAGQAGDFVWDKRAQLYAVH